MSDSFLPENYEAPKGGGGNYLKFQQGDNRFRILSKPVLGWLDWGSDNKPIRIRHNEPKPAPFNPAKPVKHFWAMVVWSEDSKSLMILEITQAGIQAGIQTLAKDPDWGSPFDYDICVTKSGQEKDTKYVVNPKPHRKISEEMEAAMLATYINLDALFTGGDPFAKGVQS
jgi:hypothetical protein